MSNVVLLTAVIFLLFMSRGITGPVNSLYVRSLGASYTIIGVLGTVGSLTGLVFSYLWGHISDRMARRKRFMMIGLGGISLSLGLTALVPSYVYLFPLRILGAIGQAAYGTTSLALMGDLLERRRGRGRSMGTYRGLASLGFGMMAFVSGTIADRVGLPVPFALGGAFVALAFLVAFAVREVSPLDETEPVDQDQAMDCLRASDSRPGPAKGEHLAGHEIEEGNVLAAGSEGLGGRLPIAPLLASAFLWSLVTSAVYAVWANYMVEELSYTPTVMSRLWATASLSEFPLMIVAGWLSDRVGRLPMLSLGFLTWAVVFLGYVAIPMMPWIMLIQLTRGFAYSAYTATAMTYATEVRSQAERGRASGLFNSAGGLGMILGAVVGGVLAETLGFAPMILIAAGVIFAGALYLGGCAIWWNKVRSAGYVSN